VAKPEITAAAVHWLVLTGAEMVGTTPAMVAGAKKFLPASAGLFEASVGLFGGLKSA
jgi:hypothetical protein